MRPAAAGCHDQSSRLSCTTMTVAMREERQPCPWTCPGSDDTAALACPSASALRVFSDGFVRQPHGEASDSTKRSDAPRLDEAREPSPARSRRLLSHEAVAQIL